MTKADRRTALSLIVAGAASLAVPDAQATIEGASFRHGVASGDPARDGAVIWTRVTPRQDETRALVVNWWVRDANGQMVASGRETARSSRDYTVKVEVAGLHDGAEYRYGFRCGKASSSEGRFRTLPAGSVDRLDLAVASCQLYQGGYYNAYAAIARLERLDAVIHLGDYIYEYGADFDVYGGGTPERVPDPPHEAITLADYRARHSQIKSDSDMQAAHARAAFICSWDDHETANNSWSGGSTNHQPEREGSWKARKAAALQAWFEWMPIREPADRASSVATYRKFSFGNLATLFMLETRLVARSGPPARLVSPSSDEDVRAGIAELQTPGRMLLGPRQLDWLERGLAASRSADQPWQLIGNQVIMAPVAGPDFEKRFGKGAEEMLLARLSPSLRKALADRLRGYRFGAPFEWDSWDGFPAERERLVAAFARAGSVPLVLTGDSHAFWANNLPGEQGDVVARELGTSGISSPSYGDAMPGLGLGKLLADQNDAVLASDQDAKGFLKITLSRGRCEASFESPTTIKSREFAMRSVGDFTATPTGPLSSAENKPSHPSG